MMFFDHNCKISKYGSLKDLRLRQFTLYKNHDQSVVFVGLIYCYSCLCDYYLCVVFFFFFLLDY